MFAWSHFVQQQLQEYNTPLLRKNILELWLGIRVA